MHGMSSRVYRSRVAGTVYTVSAVVGIVIAVSAVMELVAHAKHLDRAVVVVGFIAIYIVAMVRMMRTGLRVEDDGVTVLNVWRRPHLRWSEIERFELRAHSGRVFVVPAKGRPIRIMGVAQSSWSTFYRPRTDTPERDWVDKWNALLARRREIGTPSPARGLGDS